MRIAITGGAGFIASQVADAYAAAGHQLLVIDDLSSGVRTQVPSAAVFAHCDIRSGEAAKAIADFKPDLLNHHAAQIDVRKSVDDVSFDADVNLCGMLNVVEAARKAGAKRVVFASSGGAIYGEQARFPADELHRVAPASPYGVAKAAGELYLQAFASMYGLHWVALRYANVYGPRQSAAGEAGVVAIFASRCLRHAPCTINGDGNQTRDFVFVEDVVRANLAALTCAFSGAVNIGTGVETDVNHLYALIAEAAGSLRPAAYAPGKVGEVRRSSLDATLASSALGWAPRVAFAEGIARTVKWFRSALD